MKAEIKFEICEGDFEQAMGRKPENESEFDRFFHLLEKGLTNGHIDWDILYECTKDAMG